MTDTKQGSIFTLYRAAPVEAWPVLEKEIKEATDSDYCHLQVVLCQQPPIAVRLDRGHTDILLLPERSCVVQWLTSRQKSSVIRENNLKDATYHDLFAEWKSFSHCPSLMSLRISRKPKENVWGVLTLASKEANHYTEETCQRAIGLIVDFMKNVRMEFLTDFCRTLYGVWSSNSLKVSYAAIREFYSKHSPALSVSLAVIDSSDRTAVMYTNDSKDKSKDIMAKEACLEFTPEDLIGQLKSTDSDDLSPAIVPSVTTNPRRRLTQDMKLILPTNYSGKAYILCVPLLRPEMRPEVARTSILGLDLNSGGKERSLVGVVYLRGERDRAFVPLKDQLKSTSPYFAYLLSEKIITIDKTTKRLYRQGGSDFICTSEMSQRIAKIMEISEAKRQEGNSTLDSGELQGCICISLESDESSFGVVLKGVMNGQTICVKIIHETVYNPRLWSEFAICKAVVHNNIVRSCDHYLGVRGDYILSLLRPADNDDFRDRVTRALCQKSKTSNIDAVPFDVLIMEYCDVGTLRDYIFDGRGFRLPDGSLDLKRTYLTLLEVAMAMNYLHQSGIVHGDLKPENILLQSCPVSEFDDRGLKVKVADFGTSRLLGFADERRSRGTPAYYPSDHSLLVSPDEVGYEDECKADVFAYGVTAWVLITSKVPWGEARDRLTMHELQRSGYSLEAPDYCPPDLRRLLRHLLDWDPKKRPRFCSVVEELESLISSLG